MNRWLIGLAIVLFGGALGLSMWVITKPKPSSQTNAPATSTSQQTSSQATADTSQAVTNQTASPSGITLGQVVEKNGKDGQACWVVVDSTVYEISGFAQWVDGIHTPSGGRARCGKDLSAVINQSPHGHSVLRLLRVVGKLQS